MLFIEAMGICFILLLGCVLIIANGVEQAVFFYEPEAQQRVISLGLITEAQIKRNRTLFKCIGLPLVIVYTLWAVYGVNGARGFWQPFWQIYFIAMAEGLFDRLFIDWYWVSHTRAWTIPGTEDLKPYIPKKAWQIKWATVIVGNPIVAAILAGIMCLFKH